MADNKSCLLAISLSVLTVELNSVASPTSTHIYNAQNICRKGLQKQILTKDNRFRFEIFCEDAMGKYLTLTWSSHLASFESLESPWKLTDRHWEGQDWSKDILSFAVSDDSKTALVSTSSIYGEGKVYILDLPKRQFRIAKIDSTDHDEIFLDKIDFKTRKASIRIVQHTGEKKIPPKINSEDISF